jgi:hypothetical protein
VQFVPAFQGQSYDDAVRLSGSFVEFIGKDLADADSALAYGDTLNDPWCLGKIAGDSPNQTIIMVRTRPATMTNMPIRNCMRRSFIFTT